MTKSPARSGSQMDRRQVLRTFAGVSLFALLPSACSSSSKEQGADAGATGDASASGALDASERNDASTSADWASGGTASMTAKASYPDPFSIGLSTCALVATTTEGPCTTENDLSREDVSEGWSGLPVRLALRVVDTSCAPVSGATVKIWHTNLEGSYSGQTPNNGMCLKDTDYASQNFFRGVQTTDAQGDVFFDTCFPGWYRGRAVHIHFQVKNGSTSYRVSQLFFPEEITAEIFGGHPEYASYGQPDTTFSNDNIISNISSGSRDQHILSVQRMSDGAMLASKVVTVR